MATSNSAMANPKSDVRLTVHRATHQIGGMRRLDLGECTDNHLNCKLSHRGSSDQKERIPYSQREWPFASCEQYQQALAATKALKVPQKVGFSVSTPSVAANYSKPRRPRLHHFRVADNTPGTKKSSERGCADVVSL